jgi:hypothetical protein
VAQPEIIKEAMSVEIMDFFISLILLQNVSEPLSGNHEDKQKEQLYE